MVPRRRTPLTAIATLAALSACALAADTPPSVEVIAVQLVGLGLTEQQLATTLCLTNPNARDIDIKRVALALDVSGAPLATGASDQPVRLPPMSSTVVPFTIVTTVRNLGPQLLGILHTGSVDYRLHGTITLDGSLGLALPFSRFGRLDPVAGSVGLATAVSDPAPTKCQAPQHPGTL